MLKLFITVLVLSDTGGVSQTTTVTEYNDHRACEAFARGANGESTIDRQGHRFTVIAKSQCSVDGPTNAPIAEMFNSFGRIIQQQTGR